MTERDIEIFLTIIEKKNLSKAAIALFMSPSSLAYRLSQLEKELNVTLFSRHKGQQNVELTPAGRSFIGIAERWSALYAETGMLQRLEQSRPFYIGGVPSLFQYLFPQLLADIHRIEGSRMRLMLRDMQSAAMYPAIENRDLDIGFSVLPAAYGNVVNEALFDEETVVIMHSELSDPPGSFREDLHPHDLNPDLEYLFHYHRDYLHWHQKWYGSFLSPAVGIGDGPLLEYFFSRPGHNWAAVPLSVALVLQRRCSISLHHVSAAPPPVRTTYLIVPRLPHLGYEDLLSIFRTHLDRFIAREAAEGHLIPRN